MSQLPAIVGDWGEGCLNHGMAIPKNRYRVTVRFITDSHPRAKEIAAALNTFHDGTWGPLADAIIQIAEENHIVVSSG